MIQSRVGILGGSFNPPTIGHMQMAAELLNNCLIDEVWMVPSKSSEEEIKDHVIHRLRMIELSVEQFFQGTGFRVKIDETELLSQEPLTTYSLMSNFYTTYPENSFSFILGSDILPSIKEWTDGEKFLENTHIFIFERPGYPIKEEFLPANYTCIESVSLSSSSAEVRERIGFVKSLYQEENLTQEKLQEILKTKSSKVSDFSDCMVNIANFNDRIQKLKKHFGVYGIVTNSVIEYIRQNQLY